MPERAVWSARMVVDAPRFDLLLRVGQRRELMDVQALVAEPAIKRFDEGIFHGFARTNEIELDAAREGPILERPRHEFRSMIDGDRAWRGTVHQQTVQRRADGPSRHAGIDF